MKRVVEEIFHATRLRKTRSRRRNNADVGLAPLVRQPQPPPPPRKIGLAGSRIAHLGCIYTVLDDSAVTGDGRRSSVIAADEDDQAGLLFLGFDETGAVCEARTRDGAWAAAHVIG